MESQAPEVQSPAPTIWDDLAELKKAAKEAGVFATDVESTDLNTRRARVISMSFAVGTRSWLIPFAPLPNAVSVIEARDWLNENLFNDPEILCVGHNLKYDWHVYKNHGCIIRNKTACTMVCEWMCNETGAAPLTSDHSILGLKELMDFYFKEKRMSYEEVEPYLFLEPKRFMDYSRQDSLDAFRLWKEIEEPALKREGTKLSKLFWELEMPLIPILMEMEDSGLFLDLALMQKLISDNEKQTAKLEAEIYKLAGKSFNIKSGEQLSDVLFKELKLKPGDIPTVAKSSPSRPIYSTNKSELKKIRTSHKIVPLIEEYRKLKTMHDVFLVKLLRMAKEESDHRIYPGFKQTGTRIGRLCVAGDTRLQTDRGTFCISDLDLKGSPNIQILTHKARWRRILAHVYKGLEEMFEVTLENGASIKCTQGHRFLTPSGWRHLHELSEGDQVISTEHQTASIQRISSVGVMSVWDIQVDEDASYLAHGFVNHNSSENPNSQNMPRKGGIRDSVCAPEGKTLVVGDLNQIELRILAHLSEDQIMLKTYRENGDIHQATMDAVGCERPVAKASNFGMVYGMSPTALAALTDIPIKRAQEVYNKWFEKFKGVSKLKEKTRWDVVKYQLTKTIFGRRRRFYGVPMDDYAHRQAFHFTVSGSAADVIKIGMVKLYKALELNREKLPIWKEVKMLAQVHDELVLEAPESIAEEVRALVQAKMEDIAGGALKVPVKANVAIGKTWSTAKN